MAPCTEGALPKPGKLLTGHMPLICSRIWQKCDPGSLCFDREMCNFATGSLLLKLCGLLQIFLCDEGQAGVKCRHRVLIGNVKCELGNGTHPCFA